MYTPENTCVVHMSAKSQCRPCTLQVSVHHSVLLHISVQTALQELMLIVQCVSEYVCLIVCIPEDTSMQ